MHVTESIRKIAVINYENYRRKSKVREGILLHHRVQVYPTFHSFISH